MKVDREEGVERQFGSGPPSAQKIDLHGPVIIILAFNVVRMYIQHKYLHFRALTPHEVIQKILRNWIFF